MNVSTQARRHRPFFRAAAALVVCVFVVLPALARANDRLTTQDTATGLKFSKNLERPHEKLVPIALAPAAPLALENTTPAGVVAASPRRALSTVVSTPAPVRAPPPSAV